MKIILALVLVFLSFNVSAECSGDGGGWGWDDSIKKTCVPCSYNAALTSSQVRPSFCNVQKGSTGSPVAGLISWNWQETVEWWQLRITVDGNDHYINAVPGNGYVEIKKDTKRVSDIILFSDYAIGSGSNLCVTVKAIRGSEWSFESAQTCVTIPTLNAVSNSEQPLQTPNNITIDLSM